MLVGRAYEARTTKERVVTMGLFGGMGLLPDFDATFVAMGSHYEGHFGHRGFTHSLLFAVATAAVAFAIARRWGTKPWFTALLAFLAVASHGLMDSMTYRTRGIPFFWPFTEERFILPWRPIPPAPFGEHFISRRGLDVMAIEMVYFLPLTLIALGPSFTRIRSFARNLVNKLAKLWKGAGEKIKESLEPAPVLVPVPVRPLSNRRAMARVAGIFAVFTISLAVAQTALKDSRPVAYLESAHDETIAVSLQHQPRFQHLR
jgi:inner membrane protein